MGQSLQGELAFIGGGRLGSDGADKDGGGAMTAGADADDFEGDLVAGCGDAVADEIEIADRRGQAQAVLRANLFK